MQFDVVFVIITNKSILEFETKLPFAPAAGMKVSLGEGAWNYLEIESVLWRHKQMLFECNVALSITIPDETEFVTIMAGNGWVKVGD